MRQLGVSLVALATCASILVHRDARSAPPDPGTAAASGEIVKEYKKALDKLKALSREVQSSGSLAVEYSGPGATPELERRAFEFRKDGDQRSLRIRHFGRAEDSVVKDNTYIKSDESFYHLTGNADSGLAFLKYAGKTSPYIDEVLRSFDSTFMCPAYSLNGLRIDKMMESNNFTLVEVDSPENTAGTMVRFRFRYLSGDVPLSGWWTVDRSKGWSVESYEFTRGNEGSTITGRVAYADSPSGKNAPVSAEAHHADGGHRWNYRIAFERFANLAPQKSAFTPSIAGAELERLGYASHPRSRAAYWYFAIAALAFVSALSLNFVARRTARATAVASLPFASSQPSSVA